MKNRIRCVYVCQLNVQRYINEVLERFATLYIDELDNVISPDLSPIEHICDMIDSRVGMLSNSPMNLQQLRDALQITCECKQINGHIFEFG